MRGTVIEEIKADLGGGRVKLGGEDWSAVAIDGAPIQAQSKVVVRRIEGNKVFVEPINPI
jgi:membrane protein implicated in regulation of membrane protease activity